MPGVMYIEQILRVFPKEYTNRLRLLPAWEETLMKYDESKGEGGKGGSASAGAAASSGPQ